MQEYRSNGQIYWLIIVFVKKPRCGALQIVSWIFVQGWSLFSETTLFIAGSKVFTTHLFARWTHKSSTVQPAISRYANRKLLSGEVTSVAIVSHIHMKVAIAAVVFVAARTPMLPFTGVMTCALFPHCTAMIETFRALAITFQGIILLWY